MQKGSTLKVMEEFNIQGKQTSFYKYCPGTFGYTLVWQPPIDIKIVMIKRIIIVMMVEMNKQQIIHKH